MDSLLDLPGVVHEALFPLCEVSQGPVAWCELLVAPGAGWAVVTQLNDGGPGLVLYHPELASRICQRYGIAPERLVLLSRYTDHHSYENVYVVHFTGGERDLFETITFTGSSRQALGPLDTPALLLLLHQAQPLPGEWRAVQAGAAQRAGTGIRRN